MTKAALRSYYKEKRQALLPDVRGRKNQILIQKWLDLAEYKDAQRILFYCGRADELDTSPLIEMALNAGQQVFLPRVQGEELEWAPILALDELKSGAFGILEPSTEADGDPQFDLILIPGLAFDRKGHRLGYGKGFYDRLLKRVRGFKVALAFSEQVTDSLPTEAHDEPIDLLLTDQETLTFSSP